MPASDHYVFMARYNRWFNARLYEAAGRLSDEERKRERGAFFGSIHGTLNHVMVGDRIWLRRFAGLAPFESLDADRLAIPGFTGLDMQLHADFGALAHERAALDEAIEQFAQALTDPLLAGTLHYTTTTGQPRAMRTWQALSHFFNHQTHHRGQVTTLLMQAGIDVGTTDLIALADPL